MYTQHCIQYQCTANAVEASYPNSDGETIKFGPTNHIISYVLVAVFYFSKVCLIKLHAFYIDVSKGGIQLILAVKYSDHKSQT